MSTQPSTAGRVFRYFTYCILPMATGAFLGWIDSVRTFESAFVVVIPTVVVAISGVTSVTQGFRANIALPFFQKKDQVESALTEPKAGSEDDSSLKFGSRPTIPLDTQACKLIGVVGFFALFFTTRTVFDPEFKYDLSRFDEYNLTADEVSLIESFRLQVAVEAGQNSISEELGYKSARTDSADITTHEIVARVLSEGLQGEARLARFKEVTTNFLDGVETSNAAPSYVGMAAPQTSYYSQFEDLSTAELAEIHRFRIRLMGRPHNLQSVVADDLIKDLLGKVTSQEPSGEDRLTRLKSVFDKFLSELAGTEAAAQVPPPPAPNA